MDSNTNFRIEKFEFTNFKVSVYAKFEMVLMWNSVYYSHFGYINSKPRDVKLKAFHPRIYPSQV